MLWVQALAMQIFSCTGRTRYPKNCRGKARDPRGCGSGQLLIYGTRFQAPRPLKNGRTGMPIRSRT